MEPSSSYRVTQVAAEQAGPGPSRRTVMLGTLGASFIASVGLDSLFATSAIGLSNVPSWLAPFAITRDWQGHLNNGSAGGVDWHTPVGTQIRATTAGVVAFGMFSDGSSTISLVRPDGTKTVFLHGNYVGAGGRSVQPGDVIGTTDGRPGTFGAGPSTGYHLHVHDVTASGVRALPFSTASSQEDDMPYYAHKQSTASLALVAGTPNRLTFNGIGDYDLAGAPAGGPGLYDITCHIYFEGLVAPASVAVQFQYENVTGGATEGWYTETVQGSATGIVKAQISTKLEMAAGRRLMLFAAPSTSGVTIPVWGRIVCNWRYSRDSAAVGRGQRSSPRRALDHLASLRHCCHACRDPAQARL